jgi:chitodextrinase
MKPVFIVITKKPNGCTVAGKAHSTCDSSQSIHVEHEEDVGGLCWTVIALFIRNLFLQTKLLTSTTTRRFCND